MKEHVWLFVCECHQCLTFTQSLRFCFPEHTSIPLTVSQTKLQKELEQHKMSDSKEEGDVGGAGTDLDEAAAQRKVVFKLDDGDGDQEHHQEASDQPGPLVAPRKHSRKPSLDSASSMSQSDSESSLPSDGTKASLR
jgi:hypothetical protein